MDKLQTFINENRQACWLLFRRFQERNTPFMLHSDLVEELDAFKQTEEGHVLEDSALAQMLYASQEAAISGDLIYFDHRKRPGVSRYFLFQTETMCGREVEVKEFLQFKERLVNEWQSQDDWVLELDMMPFERGFPRLKDQRSIGRGVEFLNRYLSNRLFDQAGKGEERLYEFLRMHQVNGQPLMLSSDMKDLKTLRKALAQAHDYLAALDQKAEWDTIAVRMSQLGFERGWGRTVAQVQEMMGMLSDLLEAPDPKNLSEFLARLPMIFNIVILSPHGYFGQSNVLGLPDTGGQVVYILDQVRALEREMKQTIYDQGLTIEPQIIILTRLIPEAGETTCDQRIESVLGCENARILRVPFRTESGEIVPHWISRFDIWPYLERFTIDAQKEILAEMGSRIDFIIGNYSDGNLVATLLSERLGVTQCNIAHALEKTKYLHSAIYWQDHEQEHHFSSQFTADLIAMNTADFIITSTFQEIAGTADSVGQYESYESFTLPGLYRVINGIDVYDPKFNIVSPGANEDIFFPYDAEDRRSPGLREQVEKMIYGAADDVSRGTFKDPDKPILFAMSRLDKIKNATGFIQWYAQNEKLREQVNVLLVGGFIDVNKSGDDGERIEIQRIHDLMNEYQLDDQVRWLNMQTDKHVVGELYRCVADRYGSFVQPALFEAFGLTVVEAMSCGLPVFATQYGGPLETIVDGKSGFHIDPNQGEAVAKAMSDFYAQVAADKAVWKAISDGAIKRINDKYTWKHYARSLLSLSRIYGFWKYISNIERKAPRRYLEMFYGLMFKRQAAQINQQ